MSTIRAPAVAGRFYPGEPKTCQAAVDELLAGIPVRDGTAAIVPHAGWIYSGATAAKGLAAIAGRQPETVIFFGAAHVRLRSVAAVFDAGAWDTPAGRFKIDELLAERIAQSPGALRDRPAHTSEHSIEVQLPILRRLLPKAAIVPIMVRPTVEAIEIGEWAASAARELGRNVAFVGSTDLTHYGPGFGFEPAGHGAAGVRWAKEVNDRRMVRLIASMAPAGVIAEAATHANACGAGAIAATIAAAVVAGATRYEELEHTTSADRELAGGMEPATAVGYEAGVFF